MSRTPQHHDERATAERFDDRRQAGRHAVLARLLECLGECGAGYIAAPRLADAPDSSVRH